jgi:heterodisulfide reductase subunit A
VTCVRACPYGAPFVNNDRKAEIAAAKCMGCGICAAECPAHAINLRHFESEQFDVMLNELVQEDWRREKQAAASGMKINDE